MSGKFSNATCERLYNRSLEGFHDDETGNVDECGFWACVFRLKTGGFILVNDSQGFVELERHRTPDELERRWTELVGLAYADESEPSEDDYTMEDVPRGYSVAGNGKWIGTYPTRDEAEDAIREDAGKNFRPNVWIISDHGNAHRIENFDWRD